MKCSPSQPIALWGFVARGGRYKIPICWISKMLCASEIQLFKELRGLSNLLILQKTRAVDKSHPPLSGLPTVSSAYVFLPEPRLKR